MKNKVYIIVCMTMVALMLRLGAYAQDQKKGIEITLSNDSIESTLPRINLTFILDSETKEGKNPGQTFTIGAGKEKTTTIPADTVKY